MSKIKSIIMKSITSGNMKSIQNKLKKTSFPSKKEQQQCQRILKRLAGDKGLYLTDSTPIATDILEAYQNYWQRVLTSRVNPKKEETKLAKALKEVLKNHDVAIERKRSLNQLEVIISKTLKKEGYQCLTGVVFPHREFMIWRKQSNKKHKVPLIHKTVSVNVVYLDQFICRGWMSWASDNLMGVGGWATKKKVFCISDKYDKRTETFHVSYLSHEAQHFLDYREHPKLDSKNLEYRAKLVELIKSRKTTDSLLSKFFGEKSNLASVPHAYSSYQIFKHLTDQLFQDSSIRSLTSYKRVSKKKLRDACMELYNAHTLTLKKHPKGSI